jgi:hypothetical protein
MAKENIPFDFYSYHCYGKDIERFEQAITVAREELDKRGLTHVETNLNEWNYIRGWNGENWQYSLRSERGLKGSSFIAAVMATGQALPLDMLMYYDVRPCGMNGLFAHETYEPLKGYYSFVMFDNLVKLGKYAKCEYKKDDVYTCAATDGKNGAVMLTHFDDVDEAPAEDVRLELKGLYGQKLRAQVVLLDGEHDNALVREEILTADQCTLFLSVKLFDTCLIRLSPI